MAFLTTVALGVALFVVGPYLAHRLRRRQAQDLAFPPARLVARSPENARRRSQLEDRALLATRVVAVVGLAVLGATPFIRCSRLALQRPGGASLAIALVVDDSMSMRASAAGKTRFERARGGAHELLASLREGDAVALILAGAPARVALAATTDLGAAREAVASLTASDRGTDLEGAVSLGRGVLASLPQIDRRVVVLSDLADGHPDAPPLAGSTDAPLWIAMPELASDAIDCAVLRADRRGPRVRAKVSCGPGKTATGRELTVEDASGKTLARVLLSSGTAAGSDATDITILLPSNDAKPALVRLGGVDAIAADDVAPVVTEAGRGAIVVVGDATDEAVATGGAPIVEQALTALRLDIDLRPLPSMPDGADDLAGSVGLVLDDPPGFTPEQRHALTAFLDRGGAALVALGARAASAPLGATLEPILGRAVVWAENAQSGGEPASVTGELAGSAESLTQLGARRRATLAPEDTAVFERLADWTDGALFVGRRAVGRGAAWIVTVPFSVEASDLPLRPAFLALLDMWAEEARRQAAPARSDVGTTWKLPGARDVEARGPGGPLAPTRGDGMLSLTPSLLGTYAITVDGQVETRVAAPDPSELDLRPRQASASAPESSVGERRASVDVSGEVALALLALMVIEMALRLRNRQGVAGEAMPNP